MNKFRLQRVEPTTHAIIYQKMWDGSEEPISTKLQYSEALKFIQQNQKELKTFKVMEIYNRKNARRHVNSLIYAEDKNEALEGFDRFLSKYAKDNVNYELLTGDWKLIATRRIGEPIVII